MRLKPVKSYVVRKICPRTGAAGSFKNFQMLLPLLINVTRNAALQTKRKEIATI
jgi:hypothetical protein